MNERHQLRLSGVRRPAPTDRPLPRLSVPQLRAGDRGDRSRRTTGGRMTHVRRLSRRGRLTFKTERRKETGKARLRNIERLGEGGGGAIPPGLDTYVFSRLRLKSIDAAVAASVISGAFVARRRALSEVISRMQIRTSAPSSEFDVQLQLYSDNLLPESPNEEDRIDAFDTSIFQPSNLKPTDGERGLTDLTDLTANRIGVYIAGAHARPRSPALVLYTSLPFRSRQIRQIRQPARLRRVKSAVFRPPGVKSVKSTLVSDSEVTA